MLLRTLLPSGSVHIKPSPTAVPSAFRDQDSSSQLQSVSHSHKSFFPCPTHFLSIIFQLCEKDKDPGNKKLGLFPPPSLPAAEVSCSPTRPTSLSHWAQWKPWVPPQSCLPTDLHKTPGCGLESSGILPI